MWRSGIAGWLLASLLGSSAFAQDRTDAVQQLQPLKTVPGSVEATTLPPDGRPWILFIFKACCSPADQAAHWVVSAQEKYGATVGILGLNVNPAKTLQQLPNWLHGRRITFPVLSDPAAQVARSWGVIAPPTVIILDENCREIYRTMGFQASYGSRLESEIEALLHLQSVENPTKDTQH